MTLRKDANDIASKSYSKEEDKVKEKRKEAINRWRERNPDLMLVDDPPFIYKA
jgi:predicted glycosyltransferase